MTDHAADWESLSNEDLLDELIAEAIMDDGCDCEWCGEQADVRYASARAEVLHRLEIGAHAERSLHAEYCADIECRHE